MGKPILHGSKFSPFVRAVLLTAHAIDLDFEFNLIDPFNGDHLKDEYLKMNPQHKIPTLEDDGKYICDSHAIITYLVDKYGKDDSLYPQDLFIRAIINQRLHFDSGVVSPHLFRFRDARKQDNMEEAEKAKKSLLEAFEILEKFLGDNQYLTGKSLTVADLSILGTVSSINLFIPVEKDKFPKLAAWLNRMTLLPYYEKANKEGLEDLVDFFKRFKEAVAAQGSLKNQ